MTPPPATVMLDALLIRWRNGDQTARTDLIELSSDRVRQAVREELDLKFLDLRVRADVHTADVQEKANAKIRAWVEQEHVTPPETLRVYFAAVRTIIRRTLIDFARYYNVTGRRLYSLAAGVEPAHHVPLPDDRPERVWELVEVLPADEREALELKYLNGLTFQEIRQTMNLTSLSAAYRLVEAALTTLRNSFGPDNFG